MRKTRTLSPVVRRERCSEAPAIARTHRAAIRGIPGRIYSQRQKKAWLNDVTAANELKGMRWRGRHTFVATVGRRVVGYSAYMTGHGVAMYVSRRFWGRGVGSRLLEALEAVARRKRVRHVEFYASVNAVPFYRKRGYRIVKWTRHMFRLARVSVRCAVMRKRFLASQK